MQPDVKIPTGVDGLDQLLSGGLRRGGLHVLLGGPGMGKSVLAHEIGAHLIREGGKVLYMTALVETHEMLLAQARTFRFFDPGVVPDSFYYASLYPSLERGGLNAARAEISRLIVERQPMLLILDGVHALKFAATSPFEYQRFMHEMEGQAAVMGVTTLMLAHPPSEGIAADPTFTIADAIFHMRTEEVRLREVRMFSVGKLRGVSHVSGWHTFEITADGIRIYQRVESMTHQQIHAVNVEFDHSPGDFLALDIDGTREMLGGGLGRNTVTLAVGTPGSGKTLLGMSFLTAGAACGEAGLLLGYHESPEALVQKAASVGLPMGEAVADGLVHIQWQAPSEMLVDREVDVLLELIEKHRIRRVVIDAMEDLRHAVIPRAREVSVFGSLANLLRSRGVTAIMLQDLSQIVGVSFELPMAELSALMDNVLHLRYVEGESELRRMMAVLKIRAQHHDHALRELHISSDGMKLGKPFAKAEMILTGLGLHR